MEERYTQIILTSHLVEGMRGINMQNWRSVRFLAQHIHYFCLVYFLYALSDGEKVKLRFARFTLWQPCTQPPCDLSFRH